MVEHGGADHEVEVVVGEVQLVEVTRHAGDLRGMRVDQGEDLGRALLQQAGGGVHGDDFDHLGQLGELGAEPGATGADFQDASAKLQPALLGQEGQVFGEVLLHAAEPFGFAAELPGQPGLQLPLRDALLLNLARGVALFLHLL